MARVLITGSSDGLGLLAAQVLHADGHQVTLHARNEARAADARAAFGKHGRERGHASSGETNGDRTSDGDGYKNDDGDIEGPEAVVLADLASMTETRDLARQVNALGRFDAVIHNAGVGYQESRRIETVDGLSQLFAVNVLAPYLLTALITRPDRLIYLSSGMHRGGDADLSDAQWTTRRWNGSQAYSDSKLYDLTLALAVARRWPGVRANAVDPGWVPTRMGGPGAPDDLGLAAVTQAWLAVSDEPAAAVSGQYLFHQRRHDSNPAAASTRFQDELLAYCADLTGATISAD